MHCYTSLDWGYYMSYSLKSSAIILSPSVKEFLDQMERRVPFDFVVTSGNRTPRQQTNAMYRKIGLGEDLRGTYRDQTFATRMMDAYPDVEAGTAIVQEYADAGGGSDHLRGLGVDLRTRDISNDQRNTLMETARSLGATTVIYEPTPPHIHITVPKKKMNLGTFAVLFLLIRGVLWVQRQN